MHGCMLENIAILHYSYDVVGSSSMWQPDSLPWNTLFVCLKLPGNAKTSFQKKRQTPRLFRNTDRQRALPHPSLCGSARKPIALMLPVNFRPRLQICFFPNLKKKRSKTIRHRYSTYIEIYKYWWVLKGEFGGLMKRAKNLQPCQPT